VEKRGVILWQSGNSVLPGKGKILDPDGKWIVTSLRKRAKPVMMQTQMRKIKILEHVSLDGVMDGEFQNENGESPTPGGWTVPFRTPAGLQIVLEAQGSSFDLLLGRRTYDAWSEFWPKAGNHPAANALNTATKYVVTHRPDSLTWGPARDLGADILAGIRNVKSTDGPDLIVWGSSTLTSLLLEQGLVDEVVLIVYPVLLGRGKRFFASNADPRELAFVSTKVSSTGVLINTYRQVGSLAVKLAA
jgi:dihydrofolate reductase